MRVAFRAAEGFALWGEGDQKRELCPPAVLEWLIPALVLAPEVSPAGPSLVPLDGTGTTGMSGWTGDSVFKAAFSKTVVIKRSLGGVSALATAM